VHSSRAESASVITNFRIIQVNLFHKDNTEKAIKFYALLDDASDTTFVTTQVQRELSINGVQTSLDLSTMLGRQRISVERIDGLVVQRLDKRTEIELPKTYARETIHSRQDLCVKTRFQDRKLLTVGHTLEGSGARFLHTMKM